jgi:hypothetical protein
VAKAFLTRVGSKRRRGLIATTALDEIRKEMNARIKPAMEKSLERVVADWDHKPEFRSRTVVKPDSVAVYTFPAGENKDIFKFVDRGTKPHKIRAKNAPRLAFQVGGGYVPKTLAKPARTVQGGGYVKPPTTLVRPIEVDHPGSEARDFTGAIARDLQPEFKKAIDAAFKRAARKLNS